MAKAQYTRLNMKNPRSTTRTFNLCMVDFQFYARFACAVAMSPELHKVQRRVCPFFPANSRYFSGRDINIASGEETSTLFPQMREISTGQVRHTVKRMKELNAKD